MKKNEKIALETGDVYAGETDLPTEDINTDNVKKGKVSSLVVPIVVLIACCVGAMIYNGYFYDWDNGVIGTVPQCENVLDAFANCDAGSSLAMGSGIALIITFAYYLISKKLSFKACMESIAEGFKSMVPAILILTFAWTLCAMMGAKGQEGSLNAQLFINNAFGFDTTTGQTTTTMAMGIIPALFFILACLISFATGTSWGTFGTLIPIALCIAGNANPAVLYLCMSAVLAGAVYGDHVSPISDTTIMASTGARCNHLDHVKTQFPYATIVAVLCFIVYVTIGFVAASGLSYGATVGIALAVGVVIFGMLMVLLCVLDKKGVLDKITDGFAKLSAKLVKKKEPQLSETIHGGSEVVDEIEKMKQNDMNEE